MWSCCQSPDTPQRSTQPVDAGEQDVGDLRDVTRKTATARCAVIMMCRAAAAAAAAAS